VKKNIGFYYFWLKGATVTLILLFPLSVAYAYTLEMSRVEFRSYLYGEVYGESTRVAAMFIDESGNSVDPKISDWTVTYKGEEIEFSGCWSGWCQELYGGYDEDIGQWQFNDHFSTNYYSRCDIAPSNLFADAVSPSGPDNPYISSIDTDEGNHTVTLVFDGKQDLPRIDSNTLQFEYNISNDLTISWTLPDQSQFPDGASLYILVQDAYDWTMAGYFFMPTTVDSITIPQTTMALLGSPDELLVRMTTENDSSSSRFYSNSVVINTADIPVTGVTGDLDSDNDVDSSDLSDFIIAYLSDTLSDADLNNDGLINSDDVSVFAQEFGWKR
jgi:hypothetical protein